MLWTSRANSAAKVALKCKDEQEQKKRYILELFRLLNARGWTRRDRMNLMIFILRVINLRDPVLWKEVQQDMKTIKGEDAMTVISLFDEELEQCRKQGLEQGLRQGREEGREEGLEQGLERGRNQEQKTMVIEMFREGLSNEIIARVARQTPQTIEGWLREAGV